MAREKTQYVCENCGSVALRWAGKCPECGEWNTLVEERFSQEPRHTRPAIVDNAAPVSITDKNVETPPRLSTGMGECDRVLGGGVVPGSLTLIGGAPGIGKSTLMLQVCHVLAAQEGPVLYVSGEESFNQTKLRATRLGTLHDELLILTETNVESIRKHIKQGQFAMVVVDSIQAVYTPEVSAVPGSLSQIRDCATEFMRIAKGQNVPVFLVGHVTKEGAIAGPRLLEHMVDTVLYFEGEDKQALRILRAVKNRFGSTNEIGVFEMTDGGLREVLNPSALFLDERPRGVSGSVVIPSIEGTRPLLVEVQALVCESGYGSPRRTVTGVNPNRVSLILAVLEKRAGIPFSDSDVFVNVAGGVRLDEPAVDLAVALALVSSARDVPLDAKTVAFGEAGLAGEVRAVDMARQRVAEASKFGFEKCILPRGSAADIEDHRVTLYPVTRVAEALEVALEL